MTTFSKLRTKQLPALLMSEQALAALRNASAEPEEVPEGQLSYEGYVTRNLHFDADIKAAFEGVLCCNVKNCDHMRECIVKCDSYLGQLGYYRTLGRIDPMAGKNLLKSIKDAHDSLQKSGQLDKFSKKISTHIDEVGNLLDVWNARQSSHGNNAVVGNVGEFETVHHTQVENPVHEGADFHMSKAYYDARAKKWIQRKVDMVDREKEDTYQKENEKLFRAGLRPEPQEPVAESKRFSFKEYITESELNTLSRLQPDGDVKTGQEDEVYKKSKKAKKAKFKETISDKQVQADPMSS